MSDYVDWYAMIAKQRGVPEGWRWNKLEVIGDLKDPDRPVLIEGAVCTITFKGGPRKGKLNWSKRDKSTARTFVVTQQQLAEAQAAWEAETGKCHRCTGSGQFAWRISTKNGTQTKACTRCSGTGVKP